MNTESVFYALASVLVIILILSMLGLIGDKSMRRGRRNRENVVIVPPFGNFRPVGPRRRFFGWGP